MRSICPRQDLRDLWAFVGFTMKVLETPKSPWIQIIRSDGLGGAYYILTGNLIFWRRTTHSSEFASPLVAISKGKGSSIVPRSKEEAHLHHPHCNLLANTMFDAIHYFPVIYCVIMSYVD
jgi:hypothetical protein